ncbi:class I SAM-dependent methyltransferase [Larkinella bovis]|uniref:Class I SAM-dependent methyltransferase n=1 Tax=Larkinella bovis TaxID=683041 RepID=A0ABW0I9G0_9BACT
MYQVERKLWWYRILHGKVIRQIQTHFPDNKSVRILDAGCGTGGLLDALRQAGYPQIVGFDASSDAVFFSRERQIAVEQHDLRAVSTFRPGETFDVIICDDVLYFFNDEQIRYILSVFRERLRPGGIFISNNNAFSALRGTHDIALNISRRFVKADLNQFARQTGFALNQSFYWNFLLSVPIWFLRKLQLLVWRFNPSPSVHSDVKLPPIWLNTLVLKFLQAEERLFRNPPFGSSLFTVMH